MSYTEDNSWYVSYFAQGRAAYMSGDSMPHGLHPQAEIEWVAGYNAASQEQER